MAREDHDDLKSKASYPFFERVMAIRRDEPQVFLDHQAELTGRTPTPPRHNIHDVSTHLPPWAVNNGTLDGMKRFSLMGLLYVRCQRLMGIIQEGTAIKGKFGLSAQLGIVEAMDVLNEQDQPAIGVFIIVAGKAMVLHDDLNLFPSDGLITQLTMLRDAAQGK